MGLFNVSTTVKATAAPRGATWTPEHAARYAARRDYLFLKLLLKDRDALRAARQEGLLVKFSATGDYTTSEPGGAGMSYTTERK